MHSGTAALLQELVLNDNDKPLADPMTLSDYKLDPAKVHRIVIKVRGC